MDEGRGFNWDAVKATVVDEFVIAHVLGWWGKAVILRNEAMLWTLSILFELMEKTFQHMLSNFNECWWDSWVLDVLVCNALGIVTGLATVRYFRSKRYNWRGISEQPTLLAKAKRGLLQFTPRSVDEFRWRAISGPVRCLQCLVPLAVILLFEINHFFLKAELWVPTSNVVSLFRLTLLFLMACPATKEYYVFIESDSSDVFTKLGPFAWLGMAIAFVETLLVIKFGKGWVGSGSNNYSIMTFSMSIARASFSPSSFLSFFPVIPWPSFVALSRH
jgi:phosphatidylserine synthase 2